MTELLLVTLHNANNGARRRAARPGRGAYGRQYHRQALACILLAAASACGSGDGTVQIEKTRIAAVPSKAALPGIDLRSRLGMNSSGGDMSNPGGAPAQPANAAPLFEYDLPDGWEALEPTQFRLVNLRFRAVPMAEITLTVLGGDGGGLAANINRWRGQCGLAPASDLEVAAYPKVQIFENEATYVEMTGSYQGMGGPKIEDGGLYGAILNRGGRALFVKMTGPRQTIEAEREHFMTFMETLGLAPLEAPTAPHATQGGTAPPLAPAGGDAGTQRPSPLTWVGPPGWSEQLAPSPYREVTFQLGDVEMYISLARGGATANINRWAGQLGLPALDAAGVDALPRAPMLGREAIIFEGEGTLKGMRDPAPKPDQRMLAALVEDGGLIVTVKTTGPSAAVDAARDDFFALIASIANR